MTAVDPNGLEQAVEDLDGEVLDLIRRYYALNRDALLLRLAPDHTFRILYVADKNALLEALVAELPEMLNDSAKALNEMARIGRKH